MEEIQCKACYSKEYITEKSGQHIKAVCAKCGTYIKFLPQNNPIERMPFGKFKDLPIKEIEDKKYLVWALENCRIKGSLKIAIENRIKHLN